MATQPQAQDGMEEVMALFTTLVQKQKPTRAYLIEFSVSAMENDQPQLGYAILKHSIDVLAEDPAIDEAGLFIESYRRTLLDKGHAESYGTEHLVPPDAGIAMQMIQHISFDADADALSSGIHPRAAMTM